MKTICVHNYYRIRDVVRIYSILGTQHVLLEHLILYSTIEEAFLSIFFFINLVTIHYFRTVLLLKILVENFFAHNFAMLLS